MLVKMAVAFIIMCLGTMKRVDEEGKGDVMGAGVGGGRAGALQPYTN